MGVSPEARQLYQQVFGESGIDLQDKSSLANVLIKLDALDILDDSSVGDTFSAEGTEADWVQFMGLQQQFRESTFYGQNFSVNTEFLEFIPAQLYHDIWPVSWLIN